MTVANFEEFSFFDATRGIVARRQPPPSRRPPSRESTSPSVLDAGALHVRVAEKASPRSRRDPCRTHYSTAAACSPRSSRVASTTCSTCQTRSHPWPQPPLSFQPTYQRTATSRRTSAACNRAALRCFATCCRRLQRSQLKYDPEEIFRGYLPHCNTRNSEWFEGAPIVRRRPINFQEEVEQRAELSFLPRIVDAVLKRLAAIGQTIRPVSGEFFRLDPVAFTHSAFKDERSTKLHQARPLDWHHDTEYMLWIMLERTPPNSNHSGLEVAPRDAVARMCAPRPPTLATTTSPPPPPPSPTPPPSRSRLPRRLHHLRHLHLHHRHHRHHHHRRRRLRHHRAPPPPPSPPAPRPPAPPPYPSPLGDLLCIAAAAITIRRRRRLQVSAIGT